MPSPILSKYNFSYAKSNCDVAIGRGEEWMWGE